MTHPNLNNKVFILLTNSENGSVNNQTTFHYKQEGQLVTADYSGGTIVYGKIIALINGFNLDMLYQCLTTQNVLKAGKAKALISSDGNGRLKLSLNWEWLNEGSESSGNSEYIEIG